MRERNRCISYYFQAPEPAEKWPGVLKTQQEHGGCYSVGRTTTTESEDCLYLNVYTPVQSDVSTFIKFATSLITHVFSLTQIRYLEKFVISVIYR